MRHGHCAQSHKECQLSILNCWTFLCGNQHLTRMYEFLTARLTALVLLNRSHQRKNIDYKIAIVATCNVCKDRVLVVSWAISIKFSYRTTKNKHYRHDQPEPLDNPLTTRPIMTGWELSIEPYPNWPFGCLDNPDGVFHDGFVSTRTRTCCGGPETFQTLLSHQSHRNHHRSLKNCMQCNIYTLLRTSIALVGIIVCIKEFCCHWIPEQLEYTVSE